MFIVKKKTEVLRFGLFLLLVGLMAFFVASRLEAWRVSLQQPAVQEVPVTAPILAAPQAGELIDREDQVKEGIDFFAEFRMTRDQNRSALRETLKEVMESPATSAETRQQAGEQYLAAGQFASMEEKAESLVKAKGFEDVVVNLSEGSAQVVVKAKSLTQQQSLQVIDMVHRVTGVRATAIQVIARER